MDPGFPSAGRKLWRSSRRWSCVLDASMWMWSWSPSVGCRTGCSPMAGKSPRSEKRAGRQLCEPAARRYAPSQLGTTPLTTSVLGERFSISPAEAEPRLSAQPAQRRSLARAEPGSDLHPSDTDHLLFRVHTKGDQFARILGVRHPRSKLKHRRRLSVGPAEGRSLAVDIAGVGTPSRVRDLEDLPAVAAPEELKRIDAAVAELLAEVERVLGPHGGQVRVDANLDVP